MSKVVTCPFKVLNKTYEMKCLAEEMDNLQEAAIKLNNLVLDNKTKFSHLSEFQLVLLSAVTLAHELVSCQNQQALEREQIAKVVKLLEKNKLVLQAMQHNVTLTEMS